jgi:phosphatidylglycerol:prolipoprotein diacylglycerol transferase
MLTIDIDPIAFTIGTVVIRWYGIMVALAVITVLIVVVKCTEKLGVPKDILYSFFLWSVIGGLIGAKVIHVIDHIINNWSYQMLQPREIGAYIMDIGFAGLALHGAIIGAVTGIIIYAKVTKIELKKVVSVSDCIALGAPLAQAVGRLGCLINGCCHGIQTNVPWAIIYTHPNSACRVCNVTLHPTQLYFFLWNMVVFFVLLGLRNRLKQPGILFLLYLCLYSAGDFTLRFLRDNEMICCGLQQGQFISLVIFILSLSFLLVLRHRFKKTQEKNPTDSA